MNRNKFYCVSDSKLKKHPVDVWKSALQQNVIDATIIE